MEDRGQEAPGDVMTGLRRPAQRREFLRWSGASLAVFAVVGCDDKRILEPPGPAPGDTLPPGGSPLETANFGTGDIAVLNYAYALEQLEALFYSRVVASPYAGITAAELQMLTDIRNHEIAHRDFLRVALGDGAIPGLTLDFTAVDFNSRDSVLATARTFEDLGVSAYNGAGQLLENPTFLLIAGKIVSVEARHAAAIRDTLSPRTASFAEPVNAQGLDVVRPPAEVLAAAAPFISNPLVTTGIPSA